MTLRLATCQKLLPHFHDDAPLPAAFARRGIETAGAAWQDIDGSDPVAVRSVWDYTLDIPGFRAWLDRLDVAGAVCINPTSVMRANLDKRYLLDIEAQGHAIVPTIVLERFDPERIAALADAEGWGAAVAKPIHGAGAEGLAVVERTGVVHAFDLSGNTWSDGWSATPQGACLVQPKLESIRDGEWSLLYFGGVYSHAVLKRPAPGDIRVQEEHKATSAPAEPPAHVRKAADAIMRDQGDVVYARVDGVDDPDLGFVLMELEMIEPELFFRYHPAAIERYCDAVAAMLHAA